MKYYKTFLFMIFTCMIFTSNALAYWWQPPTVCKMDTTKCYTVMGAGFDTEMWDATSKCRGMKYICPAALVSGGKEPILMGKRDLTNKHLIKSDYDINLYSAYDDCFGMRRLSDDGTQVYYNGKYINIWCDGVLSKADEILENGEVTYGAQPTCTDLAKNNYVGIVNGTCFGKYYDTKKYSIECGTELLPRRLIVMNNAYWGSYPDNIPVTQNDADKFFEVMYDVSLSQQSK